MDHSHMDHSHMDHGDHAGHNMPGMDHGPKCNMNVRSHPPCSADNEG